MLLLAAILLAQGAQAPDEVRVSSHNYVPQSPYTLRVDTKLVEIEAVVRDGHGRSTAGLTKDDFKILDGGKLREIEAFAVDTLATSSSSAATAMHAPSSAAAPEAMKTAAAVRPPRFLALFIDDVNAKDITNAGDLKRTQVAAQKFVKEAFHGDVRMGVFTASGKPTQDFTTDQAKVLEAVAQLKPHMRLSEDGISGYCLWVPPYLAYEIAHDHDRRAMFMVLADAAWKNDQYDNCPGVTPDLVRGLADRTWQMMQDITTDTLNAVGRVVVHLAAMPGRRELLMASSGFIADTMQPLKDKIIDHALRAGVVISALDSKGLFVEASADPSRVSQYRDGYETTELPFRVQAMDEAMANLAEATGGVFYHNNNDLAAGFREMGGEPEVTYRLSFRPEGVAPDGAYHKLKISLAHAKKYYSMQARPGYFAPNEKAEAESLQSKIDREILANDTVTGFPVGIAVERQKVGLTVIVKVDISKLHFLRSGDRHLQRIAFTTALIDRQGKVAAAKEGLMDLALTDATYKRLTAIGVNALITLPVQPGAYTLRQVSEEAVEGKIACSSHTIAVK